MIICPETNFNKILKIIFVNFFLVEKMAYKPTIEIPVFMVTFAFMLTGK